MGIMSLIIKKEEFERKIEDISSEYKPIIGSSFITITSTLFERLKNVEKITFEDNDRNLSLNYQCENANTLESYLARITTNTDFMKYELSEPFGIFSKPEFPFNIFSEEEIENLLSEPIKYVNTVSELYRHKAA